MEAWAKTDTNRLMKHLEKIAKHLGEISETLSNPPVSIPTVTTYPPFGGDDLNPHRWYEDTNGKWVVVDPNENDEKPDTEEKE